MILGPGIPEDKSLRDAPFQDHTGSIQDEELLSDPRC
jgi:hypothetical protein